MHRTDRQRISTAFAKTARETCEAGIAADAAIAGRAQRIDLRGQAPETTLADQILHGERRRWHHGELHLLTVEAQRVITDRVERADAAEAVRAADGAALISSTACQYKKLAC